MKLLRYGPMGREKPGALDDQGRVRDLSAYVGDIAGKALLPKHLARLQQIDLESCPIVAGDPQKDLRLGPCVGQVQKFIGIGLNYADHAAETGAAIPSEPIVFSKWTSSICGPDDDVFIPPQSEKTDWEVELGVVIGQGGKHIAQADAMAHIAGYCVVNDISERSWQIERGGTWDKGKGFDRFGPIGPWLVTKDEIENPQDLELWLDVDGVCRQLGSTATMIFDVPYLVSYVSRFLTLSPGDIITTGTPPGVGMGQKPPVYLKAGQVMHLGVTGLGTQTQKVYAEETALLPARERLPEEAL